jgi:hypothetical protein
MKRWNDGEYEIIAYEFVFNMDGVERSLLYVKFTKRKSNGKRSQVADSHDSNGYELKDCIQNNQSKMEHRESGIQQSEKQREYGLLLCTWWECR